MKNSFNLLLSCLAVIDILFNILAVSDYAFFRGNPQGHTVTVRHNTHCTIIEANYKLADEEKYRKYFPIKRFLILIQMKI